MDNTIVDDEVQVMDADRVGGTADATDRNSDTLMGQAEDIDSATAGDASDTGDTDGEESAEGSGDNEVTGNKDTMDDDGSDEVSDDLTSDATATGAAGTEG